jgi:ketosteroid isomerase-like protein
MKKINFKLISILSIILLVTVNTFSQSSEDIKSKIEKNNKEMAKAMLEGNSEKSLSFYAPDAISMPSYSKMVEGIEAIKKSNMEMMKSGTKVTSFETNILKINTCNDIYTEIGTYKISISMAGMDVPMNDIGKYVTIWEKQKDGTLKIKLEIWNSDNNPWEHKASKESKGSM